MQRHAAYGLIPLVENPKKFPLWGIIETLVEMNTVISAVMILCIFGMVIYLTKDM